MTALAIIGGTGFSDMQDLTLLGKEVIHTPYGEPSANFTFGRLGEQEIVFLPRHGHNHTIPPHEVNYRANIWALQHIGVKKIIAVAAVGGIRKDMAPGQIAVPDQIIDYTYGRKHTFFEGELSHVTHIDFSHPYCEDMRQALLGGFAATKIEGINNGTYGATQGPRLESAAEINRMERDGCDLVGMTGMPEAALAKELGLCYACYAVIANWGAGRGAKEISMKEIEQHMEVGMKNIRKLIAAALPKL